MKVWYTILTVAYLSLNSTQAAAVVVALCGASCYVYVCLVEGKGGVVSDKVYRCYNNLSENDSSR